MIWTRDYFGRIEVPYYILCKANGDRIGIIPCTGKKKHAIKFNAYNEISFTVYWMTDNIINEIYDKVQKLQHVELPGIGRFVITSVDVQSEGTENECKSCTALSEEVLLAQKYLEKFVINKGTTESLDDIELYNISNPDKSLLHLILAKCPDWKIGHVDTALMSMQRSFEIDRQDIYATLTSDVETAFECIVLFDTLHHLINIYAESTVGKDTNVYLSYDKLLKSTNISASDDDIKTCLTVSGADEMKLNEANMGYDRIYNLDYFYSTEFMSQDLYDAYTLWIEKWNENLKEYNDLIKEFCTYSDKIEEATTIRQPETESELKDWTKYGLTQLQEELKHLESQQVPAMESGQGDPSHKDYNSFYLPLWNDIQNVKAQIVVVEAEIAEYKRQRDEVSARMGEISTDVAMNNNFTAAQLEELSKFVREDELSSDNYVITDTMTEVERIEMLEDLLEYGARELAKVAQPTLQFSADILSPFTIPELQEMYDEIEPGNYVHIGIRDDFIVKARMLTMEIDYNDLSSLPVTFGNLGRVKGNKILSDITDALTLAQSAATSVSFNASYWNQANKDASDVYQMINDGLLAAGQQISTTKSDVVYDDRGIFVYNKDDMAHPGDAIFLGGGRILFTDNDFQSVQTGLGRLTYTKNGQVIDDFGLISKFVIAGYIKGSTIEGSEIIGTTFDNGKGTFHVDADGNLTANSGQIGDCKIENGVLQLGTSNSGLSGTIKSLGATVDGLELRVGDAEGNYSSLNTTVNGIKANVQTLEGNYSSLSLSVTGLTTEVGNTQGDLSKLEQKVDGFTLSVKNETGTSSTLSLSSQGTELSSATITLKGVVTFEDLATESETTVINGSNITTGTIDAKYINTDNLTVKAANVTGELTVAKISVGQLTGGTNNISDTITFNGPLVAPSATIIGNITATSGAIGGWNVYDGLLGSAFQKTVNNTTNWYGVALDARKAAFDAGYNIFAIGRFDITNGGSSAKDAIMGSWQNSAFKINAFGHVEASDIAITGGGLHLETNNGQEVGYESYVDIQETGYIEIKNREYTTGKTGGIRITTSTINYADADNWDSYDLLEFSSGRIGHLRETWHADVSIKVTSDKNKKNSIEPLQSIYSEIFDRLNPVTFKYNNGNSDRIHVGLIAQEVEEAVISEGLTTKEFAPVCYDIDANGNKTDYGIRYEELVSMCIYEIQKLKNRIAELES